MNALAEPTFFVAGTQKAGTTFLCHQLAIHPEIFFSAPKELLFFQQRDLDPERYRAYVSRHFAGAEPVPQRGEGSTVYFQSDRAQKNLLKLVGSPFKLVVSLRHPVDKALSFYMHNFVRGRLDGTEPIDELATQAQFCHIRQSRYADAFSFWLGAIGRERIFVTTLERLKSQTQEEVARVCRFLKVGEPAVIEQKNHNRGVPFAVDNGMVTVTKKLELQPGQTIPRFSLDQIRRLQAQFVADLGQTEALIGASLSDWKELPGWVGS